MAFLHQINAGRLMLALLVPGSVTLLLLLGSSSPRALDVDLAGIAHLAFRVSDVRKSREFYERLGFAEAFAFDDAGKPEVSYIKINDRQFVELYARANPSQPIELFHVCYESADIEALRKAYLRRGLNPPTARKARAGNLLFSLHDADGRLIEYTQYLPGSLHYDDRGKHLGPERVSTHIVRVLMPVDNLPAQWRFYTSQLGFARVGGASSNLLRLPGDSRQQLQLESAAAPSGLAFSVANLQRAAATLRSRGFQLDPVSSRGGVLSFSDPDGIRILFILEEHP